MTRSTETTTKGGRLGAGRGRIRGVAALVAVLTLGSVLAAPSSAAPVQTGYTPSEYRDVAGAANYLGVSQEYLQRFGVATIRFLIGITGQTGKKGTNYGPYIDTAGPYQILSDYQGEDLAAIYAVMDFHSVNPQQAQKIGAAILTFLSGVDARNKGVNIEAYKPDLNPSTTTTLPPLPRITTGGQPARILAIGDSITQGDMTDPSAILATYRRPLWKLVTGAGFVADFVGRMSTVLDLNNSPSLNNTLPFPYNDFDMNHEGAAGRRVDQLLAEDVESIVAAQQPHVVLLHLGTNDLLQNQGAPGTSNEIRTLIGRIRAGQPGVVILLAKIIPSTSGNSAVWQDFNSRMDQVAADLSMASSPIYVVDHYAGFDTAADLADDRHPDASGEEKMAQRWFATLDRILPR